MSEGSEVVDISGATAESAADRAAPGIGKLTQTSLRARIEQAVAAAIVSGEMAPGEIFSAPGLAARFDVSATPVREAMLNLEKRGFVKAVRNKGFRVTEVDRELLTRLAEVRHLLEPESLAQLAGRFTPEMATDARALADAIVAGAANEDLAGYLEADRRFHLLLIGYLGNPYLSEIVADLRERTRLVGLTNLLHTDRLEASAQEHHGIVDLLERHDADGVRELMHRHIGHVTGWWSGAEEGP
jgi:DNA-binding GntR family transcriptional regulator